MLLFINFLVPLPANIGNLRDGSAIAARQAASGAKPDLPVRQAGQSGTAANLAGIGNIHLAGDSQAALGIGRLVMGLTPKNFRKQGWRHFAVELVRQGNALFVGELPAHQGAQVFQDIANYCDELGVESVYFYAFSTENWKRPAEEVGAIMRLFGEYLIKGFDYENRNVRICFMGDRTVLEPKLQELMNKLERDSACKTGLTINIAINYGGRPEIVRAAQSLAAKVAAGEMKSEDITEEALSAQMYTAGQKDPDFILRPSGEKRLSNFMLWQAAYSELVEMDVLWPDFTRDDLDAAIMEFNRRSRRFGGL